MLSTTLLACAQNKAPENILPREKFIHVLIEMHLLDAELNLNQHLQDKENKLNYAKYKDMLAKNGADSLLLQSTFEYYKTRNEELLDIYRNVLDSLNYRDQASGAVPAPAH